MFIIVPGMNRFISFFHNHIILFLIEKSNTHRKSPNFHMYIAFPFSTFVRRNVAGQNYLKIGTSSFAP